MDQPLIADDVVDAMLVITKQNPSAAVHDAVAIAPLRAALLYARRPQAAVMDLEQVGIDIRLILSSSQLDEREGLPGPIPGVLVRPSNDGTLKALTQRLPIGYAAVTMQSRAADHPEAIPADNGDSHPAGHSGAPTEDPQ